MIIIYTGVMSFSLKLKSIKCWPLFCITKQVNYYSNYRYKKIYKHIMYNGASWSAILNLHFHLLLRPNHLHSQLKPKKISQILNIISKIIVEKKNQLI